ncbi:HNH endonuclease signature motif containing protein [Nocardioides bigeumensis]|uniref:HNH nuclease domain-containing protein n=1 Tax=Nocardioides bigeumensis TaxID=433657 RepID=A0ABN2Y7Y3_9ACTN
MTAARDEQPGLDDLGPSALLDALAVVDRRARQAEADKLQIAYQWAIMHPATAETGTSTWGGDSFLLTDESLGGDGCPGVEAFVAEPLAVTLEISPASARQLIADALDLRHRLPLCHGMVESLKVPAWKARRVATATHHLSREAALEVDRRLAPRLKHAGPRVIDKAIAMVIAKHQPDQQAEAEQAATAGWEVTLFTPEAPVFAGSSELHITGDTVGLTRLYKYACRQAKEAGKAGDDRPLGARKADALCGLVGGHPPVVEEEPLGDVTKPPHPTTAMTLYVHADLTDLLDEPVAVGEVERLGPITTTKLHEWIAHTRVKIQPVIWMDTGQTARPEPSVDRHDPPERIREQVILRDKTCVFPGCQVDARRCDVDHIEAYNPNGPPGQTAPSKLACLCRRHHRAKTAGLWRYWRLPAHLPDHYVWTGPCGITARA